MIEDRNVGEGVDQQRLQMSLKEGRKDEQSPDTVDDARNAGQKLDGDADRPPQPLGADLGEKDRDAEADGNADQHGDKGGDERAVDRRKGAELLGDGVPALRGEEVQTEGAT